MNGDKAYRNFFKGLSKFPRFKKKKNQEMENVYLDGPEYIETQGSIILTLKNNIVTRRIRREERISSLFFPKWDSLNDYEKKAIEYTYSKGFITTAQLHQFTKRSENLV